ncbi:hypothetical protein [Thetidibacter halocola]|uniref:Uncharacterized protein n=1 Tax=Thetidibacter halocola TaxID=2827239 RepID=A0A8J7W8V6_9RHOB|nr:hypothetical protein [Thetidibacter halocola]MBS0123100.1 hypothetical protein [Thetidibacter halocola]
MAQHLAGRSLWTCIEGEAVRRYLNALFFTVRAKGLSLTLPLNCDSPHERRDYRMTVLPRGQGRITVLLELMSRAPQDRLVPVADGPPVRCGICCAPQADHPGDGVQPPRSCIGTVEIVCCDCRGRALEQIAAIADRRGSTSGDWLV